MRAPFSNLTWRQFINISKIRPTKAVLIFVDMSVLIRNVSRNRASQDTARLPFWLIAAILGSFGNVERLGVKRGGRGGADNKKLSTTYFRHGNKKLGRRTRQDTGSLRFGLQAAILS